MPTPSPPKSPPRYRASIEERIYTTDESFESIGVADVAAVQVQDTAETPTTTATLSKPPTVQVPMLRQVKERYLTIRATENNEVITVIEILSPANKRRGEGRDAYETKRQKILGSQTSLVEIDLLRSGESMPVYGPLTSPYRILVSRGADRPKAELYPFALPEPLPTFPVPLRPGEAEPAIALQQLLNDVYDRARFDLAIDYSTALKPKLTDPEDAQWVAELLSDRP